MKKLKTTAVLLPVAVLSVCLAGTSTAAEFHYNPGGSGNWGEKARWFGADGQTPATSAPSSSDVCYVDGCSATVTDADVSTLSVIDGVVLSTADAKLVLNCKSDFTLGCTVSGSGQIVKLNANKVTLALLSRIYGTNGSSAKGCICDFAPSKGWDVQDGWLIAPQSASPSMPYCIGNVILGETATLQMVNDKMFIIDSLSGYGTVTNGNIGSSYQQMQFGRQYVNTVASTFAGKLVGGEWRVDVWGRIALTGTDSTANIERFTLSYHRDGDNKGTLEVMTFGKNGQPSSVGQAPTFYSTASGRLRYLGTGEETDKAYYLRANGTYQDVIDGGTTGGLVWKGPWGQLSDNKYMGRIKLCGSNTNACVIAGGWDQSVVNDNGDYCALYVEKAGSGIWRIAEHENNLMRGVFAVSEGTLQYDSVFATNVVSSLGLSSVLYKDIGNVAPLPENKVDYAVLLGGPTTNVVFDFTGTNWSTTASRKIALKGTVSHVRASSGHLRLLGGVSADEEGEKTLVLDGISEDAAIGNISDGAGRVSVTKDGPGTWRLMRNLTFGGRLDVRQGTLIVSNAKELFRWYRLKILKGNRVYSALTTTFDRCDEWALYDTEGKRCNLNLEFVKPSGFPSSGSLNIVNDKDFRSLQPGQVCWGNTGKWTNYADSSIDMLFDGKTDTYFRSYGAHSNSNPEETALPIVLRLPEEAGEVTAVDLLSMTSNDGVAQFAVDGSPDGENWYKLTEVTCRRDGGDWYSDGTDYSADHVPDVVAHPEYKLESGIKNDYSVLSNVTAVSVSAGATLKAEGDVTLPALSVDCRGGGTIDGFALASSGTIEVSNAPSTTAELPVSFVNCSGLENVSQWTLSVVGRPNSSRRIVCRNGKLYLEVPGLTVIVR